MLQKKISFKSINVKDATYGGHGKCAASGVNEGKDLGKRRRYWYWIRKSAEEKQRRMEIPAQKIQKMAQYVVSRRRARHQSLVTFDLLQRSI